MLIIGGTYTERTEDPETEYVFGSALRAAAALSKVARPEVVSCIDEETRSTAETMVESYNLDVTFEKRQLPISFSYPTPISSPTIYGAEQKPCTIAEIKRSGSALVFGMLESHPSVCAPGIVYDPQGSLDLSIYNRVQLGADRFAIVANAVEVQTLGRSPILGDAAARLCQEAEADAVVIKRGALGARVYEATGADTLVDCYQTDEVWPIGSGDVFSAVFAWAWLEDHQELVQAAKLASAATAVWCGTRSLPIDLQHGISAEDIGYGSPVAPCDEKVPVYLAGPFFNTGARWMINQVRRSLSGLGAQVFSPMHDVGLGKDEVAKKDIEGLIQSKSLLCLLDGADPGTIWEAGYAASKGIPTVGYASNPNSSDYIMLRGSGTIIYSDLATAVYQAIWAGMRQV